MLTPGTKVKILGSFNKVDETTEYLMLDPFEKGDEIETERYRATKKEIVTCDCHKEKIDEADFTKFEGEFEVIRSNEVFSKIKIGNHMISIPNSKLVEVEQDA